MIQEDYPVWHLTRPMRQELRADGTKATDLVAWDNPNPSVNAAALVRAWDKKPRWSKARKARAAFRRANPGFVTPADDLAAIIFDITPTATPFLVHYDEIRFRDPGHSHSYTCMACGGWVSGLEPHDCAGQTASADPARPFPDSQRPPYLDEAGKGASASRAEADIMDALRAAVKENW